jgi:hypothetical protein
MPRQSKGPTAGAHPCIDLGWQHPTHDKSFIFRHKVHSANLHKMLLAADFSCISTVPPVIK